MVLGNNFGQSTALLKAQKFIPLVVIGAALLAYHNSFTGPFIFDDLFSILENPTIQRLWPIWQTLSPPHRGGLTVEGRPLINLSLAINYALGGYQVWGYHALNLTVHILAGLNLLGIVRRTLLQPALRQRFGAAANGLALAVAVIWTVHPLATESVTYVVQRAESMMGLLYLLTLYCFIRGAESPRPGPWYGLCVSACALGMASKEVMVSAPLMVMLYDRTFLAGSFREVWRRRWPLYLVLASTWILLRYLAVSAGTFNNASSNELCKNVTWWQYFLTEPGVILHYLQLSVWPHPLCLDYYGWPMARTWMSILPPALVMGILLGASAWAWEKNSAWGFVSAWFFLILAPSSSFMPTDSPAFEHRMYLPLAAAVTIAVLGAYTLSERPLHGRQKFGGALRWILAGAVVLMLAGLTARRNLDYASEIAIWLDTVNKRPNNPRAHNNLAAGLGHAGRLEEAIGQFEQAVRIKPDYPEAHNNLAGALMLLGRVPEAIGHWELALQMKPNYPNAHNDLGGALAQVGKVQEAIVHWEQALRLRPDYPEAHYNFGVALVQLGRVPEAMGHYEQALRIEPDYAEAHHNLAIALVQLGRVPEAIGHYEQALRIKPDYAEAHSNLGVALGGLGKLEEAIGHLDQAVRIKPDYAEAHYNLGLALEQTGKLQEAIEHYEQALRINPKIAKAHYHLGIALQQAGRLLEAMGHYEQALQIKPDFTEAQNALARLQATH